MLIITHKRMSRDINKHEHIGWFYCLESGTSNAGWCTRQQMFDWIKNGGQAFVFWNNTRVPIEPVESLFYGNYVRSRRDGVLTDDLLALPNG